MKNGLHAFCYIVRQRTGDPKGVLTASVVDKFWHAMAGCREPTLLAAVAAIRYLGGCAMFSRFGLGTCLFWRRWSARIG